MQAAMTFFLIHIQKSQGRPNFQDSALHPSLSSYAYEVYLSFWTAWYKPTGKSEIGSVLANPWTIWHAALLLSGSLDAISIGQGKLRWKSTLMVELEGPGVGTTGFYSWPLQLIVAQDLFPSQPARPSGPHPTGAGGCPHQQPTSEQRLHEWSTFSSAD